MKRHEVSAIIGAYSRQGFSARAVSGGFIVEQLGFRTTREARIDTGVNLYRADHHNVIQYATR